MVTLGCEKDQVLNPGETSLFNHEHTDGMETRKPRCRTDLFMEHFYKINPGYKEEILQGRRKVMETIRPDYGRSISNLEIMTIPVHVIVVHRPGESVGSGNNLTEARIRSQISALNRDFRRQNDDASQTPGIFQVQDGFIEFCLASVDADGNATQGISRYASSQNFNNNEQAIKTATGWDPSKYLNIWVVPDLEELGYAYLPTIQSRPPASEDGVVVLTEVFGDRNFGTEAPFDLGRTTTHEVGHYLGLDHIWGDGCSIDDGINDTPPQRRENYDCPSHPSPSCSNQGDMFMNYMDYVDDGCMNAFTTGQILYMRRILETSRSGLLTANTTACNLDPIDMGTCSDGIKNGQETGIDCGGPDCIPCNPSGTYIDVAITQVRTSPGSECSGNHFLEITIHNDGQERLRSTDFSILRSGQILASFTWTGNLGAGISTTIMSPAIHLTNANNSLVISASNPNQDVDNNLHNNDKTLDIDCGESPGLILKIQPDDFGADIGWRIKDEGGNILAEGGPYEDFNTQLIQVPLQLSDGCYRLIMRDAYGDGLCCDYGNGWYRLENDLGEVLIESDGYYGFREVTWFCLDESGFYRKTQERDKKTLRPERKLSRFQQYKGKDSK